MQGYFLWLEALLMLFLHNKLEYILNRNNLGYHCYHVEEFSQNKAKGHFTSSVFECGLRQNTTIHTFVLLGFLCLGWQYTSYKRLRLFGNFKSRKNKKAGYTLPFDICGLNKLGFYKNTNFIFGTVMPILFFLITSSLTSYLVFMPFNYYHQTYWLFDRLLLLLSSLLVLWHPIFVPISMTQAVWLLGSWRWPAISKFNIADKALPLELMVLIIVWQIVVISRGMLGFERIRQTSTSFLLASAYITGVLYYKPFISKFMLGWHSWPDQIYHLAPNAQHQLGLYVFLPVYFQKILYWIAVNTNQINIFYTCLVELILPCIAVIHSYSSMALFFSGALLHTGIFIFSGIFFWKWIICDMALGTSIWWLHKHKSLPKHAFNPIAGIFFGYLLFYNFFPLQHAPDLAWYDTPASFHFSFQVVGNNGKRYLLPPYAMAPYDIQFSQSRFGKILYEKPLVGCLGATRDRKLAESLRKWTKDAQLNSWKKSSSINELKSLTHVNNAPKKEFIGALKNLLYRRVQHNRKTKNCNNFFSNSHIFSLPLELYHNKWNVTDVYCGQTEVEQIEIFYDFTLFDAALRGKPVSIVNYKAVSINYNSQKVEIFHSPL